MAEQGVARAGEVHLALQAQGGGVPHVRAGVERGDQLGAVEGQVAGAGAVVGAFEPVRWAAAAQVVDADLVRLRGDQAAGAIDGELVGHDPGDQGTAGHDRAPDGGSGGMGGVDDGEFAVGADGREPASAGVEGELRHAAAEVREPPGPGVRRRDVDVAVLRPVDHAAGAGRHRGDLFPGHRPGKRAQTRGAHRSGWPGGTGAVRRAVPAQPEHHQTEEYPYGHRRGQHKSERPSAHGAPRGPRRHDTPLGCPAEPSPPAGLFRPRRADPAPRRSGGRGGSPW